MNIRLDIPPGQAVVGSVLVEAIGIINGVRNEQYGVPEKSHELIANFWNCYLNGRQGPLTGKDVALMMTLFKIAREINGQGKRDNLVDAAGYIGIAGQYCPSTETASGPAEQRIES